MSIALTQLLTLFSLKLIVVLVSFKLIVLLVIIFDIELFDNDEIDVWIGDWIICELAIDDDVDDKPAYVDDGVVLKDDDVELIGVEFICLKYFIKN